MFLAYRVMFAANLPFEQASGTFDAVDVAEIIPDVFARLRLTRKCQ